MTQNEGPLFGVEPVLGSPESIKNVPDGSPDGSTFKIFIYILILLCYYSFV